VPSSLLDARLEALVRGVHGAGPLTALQRAALCSELVRAFRLGQAGHFMLDEVPAAASRRGVKQRQLGKS
jgi:hypothetical protein